MRLAWIALLVGCDAPTVAVADASPPVDSTPPYFPDAKRTLADGAICDGHDEDTDGWADVCDTCPGIQDPKQEAGSDGIGRACAPPLLAGTLKRELFDPLRDRTPWISGGTGGFTINPDYPDEFLGGSTFVKAGHGVTALALRSEPHPTDKGLVVLGSLDAVGGVGGDKAGVFLRGRGFGESFVGCYVSGEGTAELGIVQTRRACLELDCPLDLVSAPKIAPRPSWERPVLRVTAKDREGGGGSVTCELFEASNPPAVDAGTSAQAVSAEIDAEHWGDSASGDYTRVGFFAQNTVASFYWLDVLTAR